MIVPRAQHQLHRRLHLQRSPKYAGFGVVRVVPPSETVARVLPLCEKIGVTRVADVSGLDRTGIPNFTTVRPREAGRGISYYNGKGLTSSSAKAGALMEALERHTGETCALPVVCGTLDDAREYGPAVDPREIISPLVRAYDDRTTLEWVAGYDLVRNQPTFVPLNIVICPYTAGGGAAQIFRSHTNGLASGNTLEEAICHGICEVIERDALSMADAVDVLAPAVAELSLPDKALTPSKQDSGAPALSRRVTLDTLPSVAKELVRKMEHAGLSVYLRDISAAIGVASLECRCTEEMPDDRQLVHGGLGAHPDARVAVIRALTEAVQSRLAHIQGGREDVADVIYKTRRSKPTHRLDRTDSHPFASVPTRENTNIDDDIRYLLDRLSHGGLEQVVVVDLTQEDLGIPVVRVIIPRAETWSVFHRDDRARLGDRAKRALHNAVVNLSSSGMRHAAV